MKITKKILLTLVIISTLLSGILYTNPAHAATSMNAASATNTANATNTTSTKSSAPKPDFTIASQGAILMDSSTGKILYGKDENKKLYPASTTKILTAILAIENCKQTDKITASYEAVMSIPSGYANAAIQPGEALEFQDLLDMYLIHSANEIGNIFAEHISGSIENFVKLMNQKAAQLGCTNSHFTNPSGIHDTEHYSTAYDMALIAKYCMKNQTFRNTIAKTSCSVEATDKYEERYFKNTNDLINSSSDYYYKYSIGGKTGYTSQAQRCLIAASQKDGLELITVTLGAQSAKPDTRYLDTINLFEYGFSNYKIKNIATKNSIVKDITVENGTKDTQNLSLLLKNDITGIVPANLNLTNLDYSIKLNALITAPIAEGAVLGKITYSIDGSEYSSDLIANHSVEEFDPITLLKQIGLALLILFILSKLLLPKKKSKKGKSKKRNYKKQNYKKSGTKKSSIYKF